MNTKMPKKAKCEDSKVPFDPESVLDDEHLIFSGNEEDFYQSDCMRDLFGKGFVSLEEVDMLDLNTEILAASKAEPRMEETRRAEVREDKQRRTPPAMEKKRKKSKRNILPKTEQAVESDKPVADSLLSLRMVELPAWKEFNLPENVLAALSKLSFTEPTEVQQLVLRAVHENPSANILASAPTGSGKTLAFGVPISCRVLQADFLALIMVPTRELALQIRDHLQAILLFYGKLVASTVCAIVGGLAKEKQERQLSYAPRVIIATPGRLKELLEEDAVYGQNRRTVREALKQVKLLVLDEADRLLEIGHYRDLDDILAQLPKERQTFLFSATLSSGRDRKEQKQRLFQLCKKLSLTDAIPINVISSNPQKNQSTSDLSGTIVSYKLPTEDHDCALFALLKQSPILKTIVFVNSIAMLKRLYPLLALLGIPCSAVHAQMQQRARLKALARFTSDPQCAVLVATDVIGRGIDLPQVDRVVHFQVPLSRDSFIHRSGRAGRAGRPGTNVVLVTPDDAKAAASIRAMDLPIIDDSSFSWSLAEAAKPVVMTARNIDEYEHRQETRRKECTWMQKTASDLGVDLSSDNEEGDSGRDGGQKRMHDKQHARQAEQAKRQLRGELERLDRLYCKQRQ